MLTCVGDFATAIKESARDINVVIAYKKDDTYVFLQKDNIQSLTLNSKVNKHLGGVVKRVADIKAMYNEHTLNLTKGTAINLYYRCGVNGVCKKAILYVNQVKSDEKKKIITIEALDYISYIQSNVNVGMVKNTSLVDYEKNIFNALGWKYKISPTVANPTLSLGYPKGTKLIDTLEEMAIANNAIIDFGFETERGLTLPFNLPASFTVKVNAEGYILPSEDFELHINKFAFSAPVDTLNKTTDIINFEKDNDNTDQFEDVRVNLFFPSSSEQKSLGKINVTVPGATQNYYLGTVDFGSTMIPQVCCFNGDVEVVSYKLGSSSCSFTVNNNNVNAQNLEVEFFGYDIAESTLNDTDNDSNIKQISNMYIQSATAYDTRIFMNPNCTIKMFGNPLYEIGDTIECGDDTVLLLEENLVFNGGLKATLKGVVLGG